MIKSNTYRVILLVLSVCPLFAAFMVQIFAQVHPCILCVLQRYVWMAIVVVTVLNCLHRPKVAGQWFYCVIGWLFAGLGAGLASRQLYLQSLPPSTPETCIPNLNFLFQTRPIMEALRVAVQGSADCGKVHWQFLGVSMAGWSLALLIIIMVLWLLLLQRVKRERAMWRY